MTWTAWDAKAPSMNDGDQGFERHPPPRPRTSTTTNTLRAKRRFPFLPGEVCGNFCQCKTRNGE
eukprot:9502852-Pyramimonas_sp.AAC.1